MEEQLIHYMLDDGGLSALVDDRIHWRKRPQGGGMPDIVMHNIGGPVDYHMEGDSGLRQTRVQIECWSNRSLAEALSVRRAVEAALSGLRANLSGVEIQGAFVDGLSDDWDKFTEGSEELFRYRLDFLMWSATEEGT